MDVCMAACGSAVFGKKRTHEEFATTVQGTAQGTIPPNLAETQCLKRRNFGAGDQQEILPQQQNQENIAPFAQQRVPVATTNQQQEQQFVVINTGCYHYVPVVNNGN